MRDLGLGVNMGQYDRDMEFIVKFIFTLLLGGVLLISIWFAYNLNRDQALKNCTSNVEYCTKLSR